MTRYVGAIDQGTTSTRFIVFDHAGNTVAVDQMEHAQIMPQPGWVEHDPIEIWANTEKVIVGALAKSELALSDLAAVGITNQRETTVLWDKATGHPVHNALVWMDTRTADLVAAHSAEGGQDKLRAKTGLPLATYFSGLKLRWLLDNVPGAQLTGQHITDVTNASRTQLMELESLDWDPEVLALFNIPRACLPEIRSSSEVYGPCKGVLEGVPLAGILGDQQAALFGQACLAPGEAKNTYGTGCFMLMNTGERPSASTNGLLTTLGYKLGDAPAVYALEGSISIAGALVQWLRDNLGLVSNAGEIEALARTVEDNGDVYIVPAFSGLYAPHWDDKARGVVAGLTRFAGKGHFARAALEAVAFQTREVIDAMTRDSSVEIRELRTDGGMVVNELLMQFQSDILGVPVVRPKVIETTALGAAYAAGLAVGYWASTQDITDNWGVDKRWQPAMADDQRALLYAKWNKAVARSRDWVD